MINKYNKKIENPKINFSLSSESSVFSNQISIRINNKTKKIKPIIFFSIYKDKKKCNLMEI